MFPAVDPDVLRNNPDFAKLYKTLTTEMLNPDGTNKNEDNQQHESIKRELSEHRFRQVKHDILAQAVGTVSPDEIPSSHQPAPSSEFTTLLAILPPLLDKSSSLTKDDEALLFSNPPLANLSSLLPDLAALLSTYLQTWATDLAHVARPPRSTSSAVSRTTPTIGSHFARIQRDRSATEQTLIQARMRTLETLIELGHLQIELIARLIERLEAKHGPIAQSLDLRAQEVALAARKTQADAASAVDAIHRRMYSPEMDSALENYMTHLQDAKLRAQERVRHVQKNLEQYGVGPDGGGEKADMMRELAQERRDIYKQVDEVTRDLARLATR
ncbi:hypothetical protein VHEMI10007 [[Torrubiella] hemipterigena]|uniref:Uncharacterized protein n=1 Tax=[Torrubiella] hemipterigena TaxID=1531966 RepID=A0A0A1TBM5_9HYPO|nr:hypothetical protein VHEMI10007 [[Torrubiella] hemipterigena]